MSQAPQKKPQRRLPSGYVAVPSAPIIYFDFAPAYGVMAGVVQIELASRAWVPFQDGSVGMPTIETCRLRCNPVAARNLKHALEGALKLLEPKLN